MSAIAVTGVGAVSPAGWGAEALYAAAIKQVILPCAPLAHPGRAAPLLTRPVPAPVTRPAFLGHPRVRRTSPIAQYCLGAALEALGAMDQPSPRVGVIVCVLAGCVNYSRRFYDETLRDPASASPLVFPETVLNAPASHLAAYLGSTAESCTLVGDEGMFAQGLALAGDWLIHGQADAVVVVGADELDWLVGDAMELFDPGLIHAAGAGAVCLRHTPASAPVVTLAAVTDVVSFTQRQARATAARRVREQLPAGTKDELLVSSARGCARLDAAEAAAWADWPGRRVSPQQIVGTAHAAGTAWQVVVACEALRRGDTPAAHVAITGTNQQAVGIRFIACPDATCRPGSNRHVDGGSYDPRRRRLEGRDQTTVDRESDAAEATRRDQ